MKTFVKWMLLTHRYLGFALSLLFVIWFLSGFVMMYAGFPTMKYHQRLQQLPPANLSSCQLTPQQALDRAGMTDTVKTVRLGMLLDRPVYRIVTQSNQHRAVYADTGELLPLVDTVLAGRIARAFVHNTSRPASVETLHQIDQWMAAHRSQGYLPEVHRFVMDDPARTYVYVSMHTGEAVQMLNARQRFWAWLGPIPHWIYPTVLIRNRPVWSQVVIWLSLVGTVMCVAGMVMGVVRYKRNRSNAWAFSPYRKKWFRWHHYTGFAFGIFVFTWTLSGLFSMSPIEFGPDPERRLTELKAWSGGPLNPVGFTVSPARAAVLFQPHLLLKEMHLVQLFGRPYFLAYQDDFHTRLLAADDPGALPFEQFPTGPLVAQLTAFNPGKPVLEARTLTEYDDYYYSKKQEKRLPVLRIKIDNPAQSWYYVDLKTGQLVLKHENGSRLERWLYHGLHSLDFRFLVYKRPLWDLVVGFLMLGGTVVSVTGLVLTAKWLRRKRKKRFKTGKQPVKTVGRRTVLPSSGKFHD
ncbi:PepSY-associated TM helix domain-containing protein [Larkinella harenae]